VEIENVFAETKNKNKLEKCLVVVMQNVVTVLKTNEG